MTTTPAPPTDTAALNAQIATLRGGGSTRERNDTMQHYWVSMRGCQDRCARCDVLRFSTNCADCLQSDIDKKAKLREDCMTPDTDTPHLPPPPPPAPDALNAQIARLLGWTDAVTVDPEGNEWNIVRNQDTDEEEYDWSALPDYAGDPAAAFGLLDHVLGIGFEVTSLNKSIVDFEYEIRLVGMAGHQRIHPYAHAATLTLAIALACRDALLAIKGETDNGTA